MSTRNSASSYGSVAKFFHWTIALTIYGMLFVGFFMGSIEPDSTKFTVYMIHKSIGITVLFLVILRFLWRLNNTIPALPKTVPSWQKFAARFVQYSLYSLLFLMPLSGWVMSCAAGYTPRYFGLFLAPLPGIEKSKALASFASSAHYIIAISVISLIVIHVLGALKHHIIDKDSVLKTMLPCSGCNDNVTNEKKEA